MSGRILLCLLATSVALAACQSNPFQRTKDEPAPPELLGTEGEFGAEVTHPAPTGLELASTQRFPDIPLPANAKQDMERTYVYESEDLQIGRMVYTSRAGVRELAQFYIRHCPATDWKLDSVMEAGGARLLFVKPDKELEVVVRSQGVGRATLLVLNLTPREPQEPAK